MVARKPIDPLHAQNLVQGAGEIFLNSIDRDGEMNGFDLELIQSVARSIDVPLICCGGAGSYDDLRAALNVGGFHGCRRQHVRFQG